MDEFKALVELLGMLVWHPGTGVLIGLLALAAYLDYQTLRIPNWLTGTGVLYGLLFNTMYSAWAGSDATAGTAASGLVFGVIGLVVGLLVPMPLYVLRVMGAGDVKLIAMVGSFIGALAMGKALLAIFITGGIVALSTVVARRSLPALLTSLRLIGRGWLQPAVGSWLPGTAASIGRLPYGVPICLGTVAFLTGRQLGYFH
jgi:prepilin peptidase CpaA